MASWVKTSGDVEEASIWGNVAASFAVEQVGLPYLTRSEKRKGQTEMWNGTDVEERLVEYRARRVGDGGMG